MSWFRLKMPSVYQVEARGSFRINERFPLIWHLKDSSVGSTALVRNLSATGMMLEADIQSPPPVDSVLSFEIKGDHPLGVIPPLGRIVWSKPKSCISSRSLYGIEFIEPVQDILLRLREFIQQKIIRMENAERVKARIGIVLFIILTAVLAFCLFQQNAIHRNYEKSYHLMTASSQAQASTYGELRMQYQNQREVLKVISIDLSKSQALLEETEVMLTSVRKESEAALGRLNSEINNLHQKNSALSDQLEEAQGQLAVYEVNPDNLDEAKAILSFHQAMIAKIKRKINNLRQQARMAYVKVQKKRDEYALAMGNNGFIIKNGKPVPPYQSEYYSRMKRSSPEIEIDVTLVE